MTSPVAQPTVFKKHAPVFIAVIILCSVCLLLIVIGLAWARFWRRGTYKAGGENVEQRVVANDRPYYNATPSPFTDEQIMKDEVAEPSTKQPDTPMRDDEMNGNGDSTWVIPLDDAPVTYNMEDTKL
ncbi:uncharacterized protein LOC131937316 [Physella acuta]|uniref:uncharacterized protein LOC131937316 n=1 Tax=Physella acuta TaxID=109671 RepID=UPI0027DB2E44|nr:uncharacterized protein LOC131937316 [Physella acuta]